MSNFYTPIIILLVLGLSFMLLTVVFRSIVVPAKAIVMNLLSVGAAYGLITLIFQKGGPAWAASIADALGFIRVDAIESWLPLFLFSILFGLSMDYQVFLLTRIREEYDKTKDNAEAVAFGLRTTGGIITGAAVIMVAVFAAFASGRIAGLRADGLRPGGRRLPGRDDRSVDPRALGDEAARRSQLVPAVVGSSGCHRSTSRDTRTTVRGARARGGRRSRRRRRRVRDLEPGRGRLPAPPPSGVPG